MGNQDLRARQLSNLKYITATFLSPPAPSVSGQAAVIPALAGAGISLLGSGHASAEPFASHHQQKSLTFHEKTRSLGNAGNAQVPLLPWVVTSCSQHQEGVQDPLLKPHVGATSPLLHPTPLGSCHIQSSFLIFACDKRFSTWRRTRVLLYW